MAEYMFRLDFQVRDYECDMQGIVNNAVYNNYLEHARHEFIKSAGIEFSEVTRRGIHLVVVRAEVDYKRSLQSGDRFWVGLNIERVSAVRFGFFQDIYKCPDDSIVLKAIVTATALNEKGRPFVFPELEALYRQDK